MGASDSLRRRVVLGLLLSALAGFALPVSALGGPPLRLEFTAVGGGPPDIEVVAGMVVFKLSAINAVSGDLEGTLTERITQVWPAGGSDSQLPITTLWALETAEGTLEGYLSGSFHHLPDGSHVIVQQGKVLSVTGAYAALYKAGVTYRAVLAADHLSNSGTMTIAARP